MNTALTISEYERAMVDYKFQSRSPYDDGIFEIMYDDYIGFYVPGICNSLPEDVVFELINEGEAFLSAKTKMELHKKGINPLHKKSHLKYGYTIVWTSFSGRKRSVQVGGYDTMQAAMQEAVKTAQNSGWTYPKWWEFWRKHDTRPRIDI
ncbi:MAG: hypothetical protein ACOC90_05400 [Bacteroidota bacterium]